MEESFCGDPVRKEKKQAGVEGGAQKPPDVVRSPEMSDTQIKIIENKRTADKALDLLFDAYNGTAKERFASRDTSENPLVSSGNVTGWGGEIKKALVERKGSRISNKENPDLVTPLVLLAEKAFRRNDPDATPDADNKRLRETALKTVQALFERYPDRLDPNALKRGQFDRLLETTGMGLERAGFREGYTSTLMSIGRDVGKEDPYRLILHLDGTIESITKKLAIDAYDDATVNVDQKDAQVARRSDVAKILPSLKELMQLREAMSRHLLGKDISPDDVLKIVSIKDALENATEKVSVGAGRKNEGTDIKDNRDRQDFSSRLRLVAAAVGEPSPASKIFGPLFRDSRYSDLETGPALWKEASAKILALHKEYRADPRPDHDAKKAAEFKRKLQELAKAMTAGMEK